MIQSVPRLLSGVICAAVDVLGVDRQEYDHPMVLLRPAREGIRRRWTLRNTSEGLGRTVARIWTNGCTAAAARGSPVGGAGLGRGRLRALPGLAGSPMADGCWCWTTLKPAPHPGSLGATPLWQQPDHHTAAAVPGSAWSPARH